MRYGECLASFMRPETPLKVVLLCAVFGFAHASSCDQERKIDVEHKVLDSEYLAKVDESAAEIKSFFGKPLLYCPRSSDEQVCKSGAWFTLAEFVRYKAQYKSVTCFYKTDRVTLVNGINVRESSITFYTKK